MKRIHGKIKQRGFTIVEIAIVLSIGGILMASFSSAFLSYFNQVQVNTTKERIEAIQQAVESYRAVNGKLPCPAPNNIGLDGLNFGREADVVAGGGTVCNAAALPGVVRVGPFGNRIQIGAVPVRALNLSDDHTIDAWGGRFLFAMTADQAVIPPGANTYVPDNGIITINDSAGNVITANAEYIIVSHGRDNVGAFTLGDGVGGVAPAIIQACPAVGATLDQDNCDNDATFVRTIITSDQNNANRFDDYIAFNNLANANVIPTGLIAAFDQACPIGWTAYAPAQGRTVVGLGNYTPTAEEQRNFNNNAVTFNPGNITYATENDTFGTSANFGRFDGLSFYQLIEGELASHDHNIPPLNVQLNQSYAQTTSYSGNFPAQGNGVATGAIMNIAPTTVNAGLDQPFPMMPPFIVLRYCRKD